MAFAGSVVVFGVCLVVAYLTLPERVPVHFETSGDPDRVVGRTEALVTTAILGAAMALFLGSLAAYSHRIPFTWINIPHKEWWQASPVRERRLRTMLGADLYWMAAATMLLIAGILLLMISASRAEVPRLSPWSWVLIGGYTAVVLGYAGYATTVRYRPTEGTED
ncbi:hypothetical protein GCM10027020_27210 [Nocardioides salsibiostraticola]